MSLGGTVPGGDPDADIPEYVEDFESLGPGADLLPGGYLDAERGIEDYSRPSHRISGAQSIMNLQMTTYANKEARDIHESRSEKAQIADESFNAPIAPTLGHWVRAPNRWDLPGIDTISEEVASRRSSAFAQQLQNRGAISGVEVYESLADLYESTTKSTKGVFNPRTKEIGLKEGSDKPDVEGFAGFTLAHEAGHAADDDLGIIDSIARGEVDEVDERLEQLDRLSARARGAFRDDLVADQLPDGFIEPHTNKKYIRYRELLDERIADAIALTVLEPRAAQREAPELFGFLQEQIPEIGASSPFVAPL